MRLGCKDSVKSEDCKKPDTPLQVSLNGPSRDGSCSSASSSHDSGQGSLVEISDETMAAKTAEKAAEKSKLKAEAITFISVDTAAFGASKDNFLAPTEISYLSVPGEDGRGQGRRPSLMISHSFTHQKCVRSSGSPPSPEEGAGNLMPPPMLLEYQKSLPSKFVDKIPKLAYMAASPVGSRPSSPGLYRSNQVGVVRGSRGAALECGQTKASGTKIGDITFKVAKDVSLGGELTKVVFCLLHLPE